MFDGFGGMNVWLSMGTPSIHNMLGLSRVMHVHVSGKHVHYIKVFGDCDVLGLVVLVADIY